MAEYVATQRKGTRNQVMNLTLLGEIEKALTQTVGKVRAETQRHPRFGIHTNQNSFKCKFYTTVEDSNDPAEVTGITREAGEP